MLLAGLHAIFIKISFTIRHTTVKAIYQLFYLSKMTRHLVFIKRIGTVLKQVFCLIPYIYRLTELSVIMLCNYTSYDTNSWHCLQYFTRSIWRCLNHGPNYLNFIIKRQQIDKYVKYLYKTTIISCTCIVLWRYMLCAQI